MYDDSFLRLARALRDAGGRALVVGGSVRDARLGTPGKDLDIEVHGLPLETLRGVLRTFGRVDEVGRSFGVLKLRLGGDELDVSVPRRDSKVGGGHKGIHVEADPFLGVVEAARRRDLTINAMAEDPLTGELVDPFGGARDLAAGVLRAVDAGTFGEDPLRALRVVQFAGRFDFRVDPALAALCREMPLDELPAERVFGEVEKLLLRASRPSAGWAAGHAVDAWRRLLPALDRPCPPELDALATRCTAERLPRGRRLAVMLACAGGTEAGTLDTLDRLRVHRVDGVRVRDTALALVRGRARVEASWADREAPTVHDSDLRRMAEVGDLDLLGIWLGAIEDAHGGGRRHVELLARAEQLGVRWGPLPTLVTGADASAAGYAPGPAMGAALAAVRQAQLDGTIVDAEGARAWLARLRADAPPAG